jgi:hypothetical protein
LNGVEQCIFAERLVQEIHGASVDGVFSLARVRSGRDKNDRNALVGTRPVSLQSQAIHPRHPEVEDEDEAALPFAKFRGFSNLL